MTTDRNNESLKANNFKNPQNFNDIFQKLEDMEGNSTLLASLDDGTPSAFPPKNFPINQQ